MKKILAYAAAPLAILAAAVLFNVGKVDNVKADEVNTGRCGCGCGIERCSCQNGSCQK